MSFKQKVSHYSLNLQNWQMKREALNFGVQKVLLTIEVILEEYVDSIHFILSLGINLGFETTITNWPEGET